MAYEFLSKVKAVSWFLILVKWKFQKNLCKTGNFFLIRGETQKSWVVFKDLQIFFLRHLHQFYKKNYIFEMFQN